MGSRMHFAVGLHSLMQFDWEYAQTPEESSLIAAVWVTFARADRNHNC